MAKYEVTVSMTRKISVYAPDEEEAKKKAVNVVLEWDGVEDADALDAEEVD